MSLSRFHCYDVPTTLSGHVSVMILCVCREMSNHGSAFGLSGFKPSICFTDGDKIEHTIWVIYGRMDHTGESRRSRHFVCEQQVVVIRNGKGFDN